MNRNTLRHTAFASSLALALNAGCERTSEKQPKAEAMPSASFSASASADSPQAPAPKRRYMFNSLEGREQPKSGQKTPDSLLLLGDSLLDGVMEHGELVVPAEHIRSLTQVGRMTTNTRIALLEALSSNDSTQTNPASFDHAVVLSGTNDIGSKYLKADYIVRELTEIYMILHRNRIGTLAVTIPPFEGYKPYEERFAEIEEKRRSVNRGIVLFDTKHPDWDFDVLDIAETEARGGLADNEDPDRLGPSARSKDHLHIGKAALGGVINKRISGNRQR